MPRVLSVIHAPRWGGIHAIMERVAPLCADRGWPWTVVLPLTGEDSGRARLESAGVHAVEIPLRRIRKTLNPITQLVFLLTIPIDVWRLCKLIRDEDITVVQVCGLMHFHSALAGRLMGRTVIWQLHSDQPPRFLKKFFTPWVKALADGIMTAGRKVISKHPGLSDAEDRISVFFAPINTTRFHPNAEKRAEMRAKMGVSDDDILVATVGGRGPNKNHSMVVEIAEQLKDVEPRLKYAICGHWLSQHREYYEREVVGRADRAGLLSSGVVQFVEPENEVDLYMTAFDIFVLPSHGEGISVVTAEAMATALPVVVNEVGSMSDFVTDGEVGYMNVSRTSEEMAGHVLRLAQDAKLRRQLGDNARDYAVRHLDENICADIHIGAYEAAMRRRAARVR